MGRVGEEPDEVIRVLDAELEATIERLTRVRAELAENTPAQAVAEFDNPAQLRVLQRLNVLLEQAGTL